MPSLSILMWIRPCEIFRRFEKRLRASVSSSLDVHVRSFAPSQSPNANQRKMMILLIHAIQRVVCVLRFVVSRNRISFTKPFLLCDSIPNSPPPSSHHPPRLLISVSTREVAHPLELPAGGLLAADERGAIG